ncbi:MAG TPA: AEC family transporter, partial [Casimicrobiaceae bacterium]|nr:AEC family transporter [Casimicrobiaceae bacterium]
RGGAWARPLLLVALKLVFQPLVTGLLAVFAFGLHDQDAQLVILMSALPTGTGAFMLADYYRRDPAVTSATILVSTLASVVTLSACLVLLPRLV